MNKVMFLFLSLSISGSILALILFALRPAIKKRFSQTWQYYIWLVVVLRFILPFTPQISVVGELSRYIQNMTAPSAIADVNPGMDIREEPIAQQLPEIIPPSTAPAQTTHPAETKASTQVFYWQDIIDNLWLLWLGVALVLFVHKAVSYRSFVRFIRIGSGNEKITDEHTLELYREELAASRVKKELPLYRNNQVSSPMLVGIIHPALVIPALDTSGEELRSILRHELTHYKRLDFLYKWLVQIMLCLHWFNPIVYFINKQINKSCELSCDESVVRNMDKGGRITYGNALLVSLTAQGLYSDFVVSMTMSEDGNIVKERLDMIMNLRKRSKLATTFSILITLVMLCGAMATGAYAATTEISPAVNGIIYSQSSAMYTKEAWGDFSIERIAQVTFKAGETLSANLSSNSTDGFMLLYTDKNSTEEEIIVPIQGLTGIPKPDFSKVDEDNIGSIFNFKRTSSQPNGSGSSLEWAEEIKPGTYWFYLIRFDSSADIMGNVSRVGNDNSISGIWTRMGRDESGAIISAFQGNKNITEPDMAGGGNPTELTLDGVKVLLPNVGPDYRTEIIDGKEVEVAHGWTSPDLSVSGEDIESVTYTADNELLVYEDSRAWLTEEGLPTWSVNHYIAPTTHFADPYHPTKDEIVRALEELRKNGELRALEEKLLQMQWAEGFYNQHGTPPTDDDYAAEYYEIEDNYISVPLDYSRFLIDTDVDEEYSMVWIGLTNPKNQMDASVQYKHSITTRPGENVAYYYTDETSAKMEIKGKHDLTQIRDTIKVETLFKSGNTKTAYLHVEHDADGVLEISASEKI